MSESTQRAALILFGAINLGLGAIMAVSPGYFFDHIGHYGVENKHYIGDVAAFYLAAGAGLVVASFASKRSWRVPLCSVAALWYGLHALNHLKDIGLATSHSRGWSDTIFIGAVAVALGLLAKAAHDDEQRGTPGDRRPSPVPERPADYPPGD
jgi:hypothetical protein